MDKYVYDLCDVRTEELYMDEDWDGYATFTLGFNMDYPGTAFRGAEGNVFYEIKLKGKRIFFIKVVCTFILDKASWEMIHVAHRNALMIPNELNQELGLVAIDYARGVLNATVKDTKFRNFTIPPSSNFNDREWEMTDLGSF